MTSARGAAPSAGHWLEHFDVTLLQGLVGGRTLEQAIASSLSYLKAPSLDGQRVRATLQGDAAEHYTMISAQPFRVEARLTEDNQALLGECSRCLVSFGPCAHIATLAVDLASSPLLRAALLDDAPTEEPAEGARARRLAFAADLHYRAALRSWVGSASPGIPIEIAASPWEETGAHVGRAYGDRFDPVSTRVLSLFVRPRGERKLMSPREATALSDFDPKDRRVLEHARDRGTGRKSVYAAGVLASLAIDAMRKHGGVFTAGYKELLDFRASLIRPTIALGPRALLPSSAAPEAADLLAARWTTADRTLDIPFEEAVFFSGPFPYVWTKDGAIYQVAPDVDLSFVNQLADAPVLQVPAGKLKEAGAALFRAARGRGISLPAPQTFGLPPIETPRIVLRLSGEPLAIEAELWAVYREREVALFGHDRNDTSQQGRDIDCEARAHSLVERAGFVADHQDTEAAGRASATLSSEQAAAFWSEGIVALRAAQNPAIEIELAKRLAGVRVGTPLKAHLHVVLEGDWLKARLEFDAHDLPVELAEVRAALDRKERWVTLRDGTLTRISGSIAALVDEARDVLGPGAEGRLPFHQLGRLDKWIEDNDGRVDAAVRALRKRLHSLAVATKPQMPRGLLATLRPYQRLGLSWLQFLGALGAGGILADDMGLGKTIMTLAYLLRRKQDEGPAPSLVVCPTSVATNWVREAARFTPHLRVHLLHGPSRRSRRLSLERIGQPNEFAENDIVVTTYALLRNDCEALAAIRFRCVVLDEAQNIKNADSETRRAAGRLDASMRLALSGTPVENRLRELWSLASFVNPGMLGTARSFEKHFEGPISADRASPRSAELRAIVRPFLLRRTKDEVLRDLPAKTEVDRYVTLTDPDKRRYDALAHTLRQSVARSVEKRGPAQRSLSVFTALMRLRQMASDPRLVDARVAASRSAKRETFLELVRELVAEGRRALVFSQFVQLLLLWRVDLDAEGIAYEYLDGSTARRDQVIARFQEGTAPLFLISLKAGGAGLNLTAADTVIHCDPWWNPAVEDQATDRAYRIGQDKPVTVIRLIARGTIEEKIVSLKAKKRQLVNVVVKNDSGALEGITDDDIRLLLGDADIESLEAEARPPTDKLASLQRILDPAYLQLVAEVRWWLQTTGKAESQFATMVDLPLPYAARLIRGEPFPCSLAVADRIRTRMKAY